VVGPVVHHMANNVLHVLIPFLHFPLLSFPLKQNHPLDLSKYILEYVANVLDQLGCTDENTLYAQSICPDEINHEAGDITDLFSAYLGEVFHLGGLAGIPFTGKTGFGAYSTHVPDDGSLFILFAPHIGLSNSNEFGKYSRDFQSADGAACGACVGGFNHCINGGAIPDAKSMFAHPYDHQMQYIIHEIDKVKHLVLAQKELSDSAMHAELVRQMFYICLNFLEQIVNTKKGRLIMLGGIQINMPRPMNDYFQPMFFQVWEEGKPIVDKLHVFDHEAHDIVGSEASPLEGLNLRCDDAADPNAPPEPPGAGASLAPKPGDKGMSMFRARRRSSVLL
jgi:hypothetical protein